MSIIEVDVTERDIEQANHPYRTDPIGLALLHATGHLWRMENYDIAMEKESPFRGVILQDSVRERWHRYQQEHWMEPFHFVVEVEENSAGMR